LSFATFIFGRIKAIGHASKGALILLRTEASIQMETALVILVTSAGFYFDITATEWIAQTLCIGLIMGLEAMNTAAEAIADFIHPDFHEKIGRIKDIAAGAVLITAFAAAVIGLIIYIPYINALFS
jgi:diacylglycerol kinase (ATP)